ncbi:hypothetical protein AAL_04150 [Moelleriella libera RCEF 2490]|uniref:Globin n=1 Tax=Moelleriella libera RCEF 2490 TaxID=1081109 RepID=A0A168BWX7_9HYPO|nr:hypothetical protein AAL_04150 [Moelleriella libera RCEF 2490]
MHFSKVVLAVAVGTVVNAQRPQNTSICDYYTTALLKNNTASNQATLLTLLVNTVVIGNYTMPNVGVSVPGILAPGTSDNKSVNLAPYFNGMLASTNTGKDKGESVNFLDGGGADPLKMNKPANDNTSKQYFLLTHLYQFFGSLLGCSMQGMPGFDAYGGDASMYEVHKFMDLGKAEMDYFIMQVGLAAASFGVAKDDITAVATSLNTVFNQACAPPATAVKAQGDQLQAICIDQSTCPKAQNAQCDKYATVQKPVNATGAAGGSSSAASTGSSMTATTSGSATGTRTAGGSASTSTGAAAANGYSFAAAAAGMAAFLL